MIFSAGGGKVFEHPLLCEWFEVAVAFPLPFSAVTCGDISQFLCSAVLSFLTCYTLTKWYHKWLKDGPLFAKVQEGVGRVSQMEVGLAQKKR